MARERRDRPKGRLSPNLVLVIAACVAAGGWFLGTVTSPTERADPRFMPSITGTSDAVDTPTLHRPFYPGADGAGNLPNDIEFLAGFDIERPSAVREVAASIMVDLADGGTTSLGTVTIAPDNAENARFDDATYRRSYEGWTLTIEPVAPARSAADGDLDAWIDRHIVNLPGRKLPAYRLLPPLRWASDSEAAHPMEVQFEGYAIRRGCAQDASACSETHAVQLLTSELDPTNQAFVTSPAPRPDTDPGYVDPGPLSARTNHRVAWTGSEVIVWGGDNGRDYFTDGAAYDPESETWRWLPDSPLEVGAEAGSVWADDRLVVFNRDTTAEYFPVSNEWHVVGTGVTPPDSVDLTVWTGGSAYTWADQIYRFDPPVWTSLPSPGANPQTAWEESLVVFDETVYAAYLPWGDCSARQIARWTGQAWSPIPAPPAMEADRTCALPGQIIALHPLMYAWGDQAQPLTVYDPRTDTWSTVGLLPDLRKPWAARPVGINYQILLAEADRGWLHNPSTNAWDELQLPGPVQPSTSVWTGTELLNWGGMCCDGARHPAGTPDAWRLSIKP